MSPFKLSLCLYGLVDIFKVLKVDHGLHTNHREIVVRTRLTTVYQRTVAVRVRLTTVSFTQVDRNLFDSKYLFHPRVSFGIILHGLLRILRLILGKKNLNTISLHCLFPAILLLQKDSLPFPLGIYFAGSRQEASTILLLQKDPLHFPPHSQFCRFASEGTCHGIFGEGMTVCLDLAIWKGHSVHRAL